jgi:hypothetical protein
MPHEARAEAIRSAGELLRENSRKFWGGAEMAHVGYQRSRRDSVLAEVLG